jgi:hypothetical protein
MTKMKVESLVKNHNFKEHHAEVVVDYFQPKAPSQSNPPGLGLTEKEMKLMEPLVGQVERCRASCERLEEVLASLKSQKEQELERMDNWFQQAQGLDPSAYLHHRKHQERVQSSPRSADPTFGRHPARH